MKFTGEVHRLGRQGLVVLPSLLRKEMGISAGDTIEVFVENNSIVLKKYVPACIFCKDMHNLTEFKGKLLCGTCRDSLKRNSG